MQAQSHQQQEQVSQIGQNDSEYHIQEVPVDENFQLGGSFNASQIHQHDLPLKKGNTPTAQSLTDELSNESGIQQSPTKLAKVAEKIALLREAEREYKELLRQLEEDDNVTAQDIEDFKKNALIQKSVLEVRRRAQEMKLRRQSPNKYRKIKSKVKNNIKTAKVAQSHRQFKGQETTLKLKDKRDQPFEIIGPEFSVMKSMAAKSPSKADFRESQIKESSEQLNQLTKELNQRKSIQEKLASFQKNASTQNLEAKAYPLSTSDIDFEPNDREYEVQHSNLVQQDDDEVVVEQRSPGPVNEFHPEDQEHENEEQEDGPLPQSVLQTEDSVAHEEPVQPAKPAEKAKLEAKRDKSRSVHINRKDKQHSSLPHDNKITLDVDQKYIKQLEVITKNERGAPNVNIEKSALFLFNAAKFLNQSGEGKVKVLNSWSDLQQHIKAIGLNEAIREILLVEQDGGKLSNRDSHLLKGIFTFQKDAKNELFHQILTQHYGDLSGQKKSARPQSKGATVTSPRHAPNSSRQPIRNTLANSSSQAKSLKEQKPRAPSVIDKQSEPKLKKKVPDPKPEPYEEHQQPKQQPETIAKQGDEPVHDEHPDDVIALRETDDGHRIDLKPPKGSDGVVLFIERRTPTAQQPTKVQVKSSKRQTQNAQAPPTKEVEPADAYQQFEEKHLEAAQQHNGESDVSLERESSGPQPLPRPIAQDYLEIEKEQEYIGSPLDLGENSVSPDVNQRMFFQVAREAKIDDTIKFADKSIEQKTLQVQNEFERVLEELNEARKKRDGEVFYKALGEYYQEGIDVKGSPVRRLIQQKNALVNNKQVIKESNLETGDYAFTYTTGPEKTYVIEPHGQLNYNLAQKDPLKFYDQVFNQDITKTTVQKDKEVKQQIKEEQKKRQVAGQAPLKKAERKVPITMKTKVTKRPHLKIMEKFKMRIAMMLQEKMGQSAANMGHLMNALRDKQVEDQIKELVKLDKLQIVDQQNNVLFEQEIKEGMGVPYVRQNSHQVTKKEQSARKDEVDSELEISQDDGEENFEGDDNESPVFVKANTLIKIADKDFKKIENKVRDHFRRNSYR